MIDQDLGVTDPGSVATMGDMAKKKPAKVSQASDAKARVRARDKGEGRLLTVEVTPVLADALDRCCSHERRTRRATVEIALERYLQDAGFWPPPSSSTPPTP